MGSGWTTQEALQLHGLFELTAGFMLKNEDIDSTPREFFLVYQELGVKSQDVFANKKEHRKGAKILSKSLADFAETDLDGFYESLLKRDDIDDELKIKVMGDHFSDQDLGRKEAAERVSEQVDFAYHTVYDKFGDNGIRFSDHEVKYTSREDVRDDTVELLRNYAEDDYSRSEALEIVSEGTDVPEGTLRNWLVDEDITFTESLAAIVDTESKEELIETAEHYFNLDEGVEVMEQAFGYNIDTIRGYKRNEIKVMPVEVLDTIEKLFESEPVFRLDDPERYVNEDTRYGLKLDDSFQSFLFSHLTGEDFEGMAGKSASTLTRYRNNRSKTVDEEAYRKAFQVVSFMYEKDPEPDIVEYVDKQRFGSGASKDKLVASID